MVKLACVDSTTHVRHGLLEAPHATRLRLRIVARPCTEPLRLRGRIGAAADRLITGSSAGGDLARQRADRQRRANVQLDRLRIAPRTRRFEVRAPCRSSRYSSHAAVILSMADIGMQSPSQSTTLTWLEQHES